MKSKKIYLDSVSQLLIGKKKDRKAFLNKLSHGIDEYLLSAPDASCTDLEKEFGTPVELLYEYASTHDEKELSKSVGMKRIIAAFIITLSVTLAFVSILNTLWWNKTINDIYERENWEPLGPTIIIDKTKEAK